jgi:uncharacterized protein DUF3667
MTQVHSDPATEHVRLEPPAAVTARTCLNCGVALTGPFCSSCGQRDVPPYPSLRELVVDAFWELSGWDGRFAATVRALVAKPGKLTREFLEGRRARYISPLRLYLMCSLVYFLGAATAPNVRLADGRTLFMGIRTGAQVSETSTSRPERVGKVAEEAFRSPASITDAQRAQVLEDIKKAPAAMQPFLRRSIGDPAGFKRDLLEAMPRMLFALLPVFAAIVAIFYRGHKYPEHLYFAIHVHAFVFLALALIELAKFTQQAVLVGIVGSLAYLSIPVYMTLAFRHAYGGSIARTIAKEIGIGAIYWLATIAGFVVMIYIVSARG